MYQSQELLVFGCLFEHYLKLLGGDHRVHMFEHRLLLKNCKAVFFFCGLNKKKRIKKKQDK